MTLARIPGPVWTVLRWCWVGLLAAELVIVAHEPTPDEPHRLRLGVLAAVGVAVLLAVPVGWTRRWPLPALGVVVAGALGCAALGWPGWPLLLTMTGQVGYLAATRRWPGVLAGGVGLATFAVLAERLRIARDLHDTVAHSIGIIALQAGMGSRMLDRRPEEARQALDVIELTSRETLSGLRGMLGPLRAGDPDHGLAEVDQLAARSTAAGLRVDVHRTGEPRPVPARIQRAAYRVVQEATTNVLRHANIDHCTVAIAFADNELAVEVRDEGSGGTPDGTGHGLIGLRERVELHGGRFFAGQRPEGGFVVRAGWPL